MRRLGPFVAAVGLSQTLLQGGCSTTTKDDGPTHFVDAGRGDARGTLPEASTLPEAGALPPISTCTTEPPRVSLGQPSVVSDLSSFCAALAESGTGACPRDRNALLASIPSECGPDGKWPWLDRRCGVDYVAYEVGTVSLRFYFDAGTGTLLGARAATHRGPDPFPCGRISYRAGEDLRECASTQGSCSLCVAEPDECPPDISALIPTTPCVPQPAEQPGCDCGLTAGFRLPTRGGACESGTGCRHCQSGTCWSDCRCVRDGSLRYQTQCTE